MTQKESMTTAATEDLMRKRTALDRMIEWRVRHISDRQFTLLLSFVVGLLAAIAAFLLHWLIEEIQLLLTGGFISGTFNFLYLVYPVIGIFLTSLFVRYVVKDNISHGITRILYAISSKRSRLKRHNCYSSVIASAITIGFGGRGPNRADRLSYRQQSRPAVQVGQQDAYAPRGLRSVSRHSRHIQSAYCRPCLYA